MQETVARKQLEKVELRTLEVLLFQMADTINALLADGVPYTKVEVKNVPAIQ